MLRPNKPTKRKQRAATPSAKIAKKKPRKRKAEVKVSKSWIYTAPKPKADTFRKGETIDQREAGVEWERSPEAGWRAKPSATVHPESQFTLGPPSTAVHTDHPLRHFDRTCPACLAEEYPPRGTVRANALQADLERGHTLPEPMQALVHQPIQRTLWQRLCSFLRWRNG